jgi:hypothetical protein
MLRNNDGDELVLCKALYRLRDPASARHRLAKVRKLLENDDGFVWVGATKQGGEVNLGSLRIEGDQLTLETNSGERLERGKALVENLLRGEVDHERDETMDLDTAVREHRKRPPAAPREEIPDDVRLEIMRETLREHYARAEAASYDAEVAPDPAAWLARDDRERVRAVERYHLTRGLHPDTPNPHVHARFHVIVENQLAAGDPPEVADTLARLVGEGMSRHDALHAVGAVVAREMEVMVKAKRAFDRGIIVRELEHLSPAAR